MSYCAHCGDQVSSDVALCASCGKPPRSFPGSAPVGAASSKTPIVVIAIVAGLFVLLAIGGVVAAILIPNFVDALDKARQKRTVSDMRNTGAAWMSWLTEEASASAAGSATYYDLDGLDQILTAAELERQLRGATDLVEVPVRDGWQNPYEYRQGSDFLADQFMAIRSAGRDGVFSGTIYEVGQFGAGEYDQDIVWADGYFVRAPSRGEP